MAAAPISAGKKQVTAKQTECFVVATEAKRLLLGFTQPDPYSRELWARTSENVNTITIVPGISRNVMDLFNIDRDRDALNNGAAISGVGWRPQYRDTHHESENQRHHFAFHFFSAANDNGLDGVYSTMGVTLNELADWYSDNDGDLALSEEAKREGVIARTNGIALTPGQIKGVLCAP